MAEIFTVSCHNKNLSVILVIQNLNHRSCPWLKDISLNSQQIVLFRTLRDVQQLEVFFSVVVKTLPNLYYGIVEFNCLKSDLSIIYGYKISRPTCKDCGVYCRFNDLIPKCRNPSLPIFMACVMLQSGQHHFQCRLIK